LAVKSLTWLNRSERICYTVEKMRNPFCPM
jgi:hypothetical protein